MNVSYYAWKEDIVNMEELFKEINELLKRKNEMIKALEWRVEYLEKENKKLIEHIEKKQVELTQVEKG